MHSLALLLQNSQDLTSLQYMQLLQKHAHTHSLVHGRGYDIIITHVRTNIRLALHPTQINSFAVFSPAHVRHVSPKKPSVQIFL